MYIFWRKILFSTLILGSVFSDCVVFYGDIPLYKEIGGKVRWSGTTVLS